MKNQDNAVRNLDEELLSVLNNLQNVELGTQNEIGNPIVKSKVLSTNVTVTDEERLQRS